MIKVLFVCLGNICRSPLAEAIFNKKVKEAGLEGQVMSDSAGTANYHIGENPDPRTVEIAEKHHTPINHKGQQFKKHHESEYDYLIAMDQSNYQNMIREMGTPSPKLLLMRDFDPDGKGQDVPDPWYGGMDGFENVYQILDRSIDSFIRSMRAEQGL